MKFSWQLVAPNRQAGWQLSHQALMQQHVQTSNLDSAVSLPKILLITNFTKKLFSLNIGANSLNLSAELQKSFL